LLMPVLLDDSQALEAAISRSVAARHHTSLTSAFRHWWRYAAARGRGCGHLNATRAGAARADVNARAAVDDTALAATPIFHTVNSHENRSAHHAAAAGGGRLRGRPPAGSHLGRIRVGTLFDDARLMRRACTPDASRRAGRYDNARCSRRPTRCRRAERQSYLSAARRPSAGR
jgi:hypothetical protein